MESALYEVSDDSGFLALVDPDAYQGFVDEDWQPGPLLEHFRREMGARRLLLWGTGMENIWGVEVFRGPSGDTGFREVTGWIASSRGQLLLTNYASLTMVAQFADQTLPREHERSRVLTVEPGLCECRIVQIHDPAYDPEACEAIANAEVHFVIELTPAETAGAPWPSIPWSKS